MSFVDQDRSREKALSGAVTIAVVGCVGYALISGLAMTIVTTPPWAIPTQMYKSPPPPPPRPQPTIRKTVRPMPSSHIVTRVPPIPVPPVDPTNLRTDTQIVKSATAPTGDTGTQMTPPPAPDLSARARPQGHPGEWVTTEDYPASALRAGLEGRTGFRLDLGTDGRATGCTVTQSSGSDELDRTACRLLERRAHFSPALGADGQPIASTYAGVVVWRAPAD